MGEVTVRFQVWPAGVFVVTSVAAQDERYVLVEGDGRSGAHAVEVDGRRWVETTGWYTVESRGVVAHQARVEAVADSAVRRTQTMRFPDGVRRVSQRSIGDGLDDWTVEWDLHGGGRYERHDDGSGSFTVQRVRPGGAVVSGHGTTTRQPGGGTITVIDQPDSTTTVKDDGQGHKEYETHDADGSVTKGSSDQSQLPGGEKVSKGVSVSVGADGKITSKTDWVNVETGSGDHITTSHTHQADGTHVKTTTLERDQDGSSSSETIVTHPDGSTTTDRWTTTSKDGVTTTTHEKSENGKLVEHSSSATDNNGNTSETHVVYNPDGGATITTETKGPDGKNTAGPPVTVDKDGNPVDPNPSGGSGGGPGNGSPGSGDPGSGGSGDTDGTSGAGSGSTGGGGDQGGGNDPEGPSDTTPGGPPEGSGRPSDEGGGGDERPPSKYLGHAEHGFGELFGPLGPGDGCDIGGEDVIGRVAGMRELLKNTVERAAAGGGSGWGDAGSEGHPNPVIDATVTGGAAITLTDDWGGTNDPRALIAFVAALATAAAGVASVGGLIGGPSPH